MKNDKIARAIDSELRGLRVSESLRQRILETADRESKTVDLPALRRPKFRVALAAACAAVMLLATVGLAAANRWGVLDFFTHSVEPLVVADNAEHYLQTDLGEARNEDVVVTLREVVFDGKGVRYALDAEPAREGTWLYSDWAMYTEDQLARPGRVDSPATFAELVCPDYEGHVCDVAPTENGLTFYEEGWIEGDFIDSLSGSVWLGDLEIPFTAQAAPSEVYRLTPRHGNDYVDILDITLTHTLMANYLRVSYREKSAAGEGSDFAVDEDAVYYTLENATLFHADRLCCNMRDAQAVTGAQLKETDKRPCPICLAQGGSSPDFWNFRLLDDAGEPLNSAGGSGGAPGDETKVCTEILQRTEPQAEWTLRVLNWSEKMEDISCDAEPIGREAS